MATPFLAGKGWRGDPHRFVTWWRRTYFEDSMIDSLCDRGHTSYRQIGHRAVSQVMRRAGIDHTQDEVRWLVSCIEGLKPLPDVLEALGRLHERYRLDDRGVRPQKWARWAGGQVGRCMGSWAAGSGQPGAAGLRAVGSPPRRPAAPGQTGRTQRRSERSDAAAQRLGRTPSRAFPTLWGTSWYGLP